MKDIENQDNYTFVKADICDKEAIEKILQELKTNGVNYSEGCWDGGETEYAIELFTDILEKTDFETTMITYYSWY